MTYYAGLDVSLRSTNICVVDDQGDLVAEGKTAAEVADIVVFLDELDVEITEVGLEAGTLTQYLTYGLQFAGFDVVCMEARQVKSALSAMRNKTDKHDASAITQLLLLPRACQEYGKSSRTRIAVHPQGRAYHVRRSRERDSWHLQG